MAKPPIYRNSSNIYPGYTVVIHGKFVIIEPKPNGPCRAAVTAHHLDYNAQRAEFATAAGTAAWAAAAAQSHQGIPNPRIGVERRETPEDCSLTPCRLESGQCRSDRRPMRVNSDDRPCLNDPQGFPTIENAMAECRTQARPLLEAVRRPAASLAAARAAPKSLDIN